MKKTILFLPACIEPLKNVKNLTRSNHKQRLTDHVNALNFWLNNHKELHILFVDNSGFSLENLRPFVPDIDRVEYLTYDGRIDSVEKGTGKGEIETFKYAYENSNSFKEASQIIKCSARYTFKGITKFYKHSNYDLIGNFKNNLTFIDSRVFAFKPEFYLNYFRNQSDKIDENLNFYFEHALACAAHSMLADRKGKWRNIPFPLVVNGISGKGKNVRYNSFWRKILTKLNYYRLIYCYR